jgi:hypothetical protein
MADSTANAPSTKRAMLSATRERMARMSNVKSHRSGPSRRPTRQPGTWDVAKIVPVTARSHPPDTVRVNFEPQRSSNQLTCNFKLSQHAATRPRRAGMEHHPCTALSVDMAPISAARSASPRRLRDVRLYARRDRAAVR